MPAPVAGAEVERLIQLLARMPGLGARSARRAALHLIQKREQLLRPLADAMAVAADSILTCQRCGNIDTADPCGICTDQRRATGLLCIVETVADLWALERAQAVQGRYHVLGGTLSPLDGIGPDDLNLSGLPHRIEEEEIKEIILAVNATVEGQTTAHYVTDLLEGAGVSVSRLAHGVPVGGELDYLDDGTLTAAIRARRPF
jgi:recombination protein RecR